LKRYFTLILLLVVNCKLCSQSSNVDEVVTDFLIISRAYVTPGAEAAIHQSSAGWFNSAKPLSKWQYNVSLHGNVLFLPESKKTAQVSNSQFTNLYLQDGTETATIPTALGDDSAIFFEGTVFDEDFEFQALEGINENEFVYGFIQATVGLPYGTQFSVRYAPSININNVDYLVYGLGLQHNVSQYFKSPKQFHLALQATYSNFKFDINYDPVEIPGVTFNTIRVLSNSILVQAIASKRLHYFEPLLALGFTSSTFRYELGGDGEALLGALNTALKDLDDTKVNPTANLGFNLYFGKLNFQTIATLGAFINLNVSVNYAIN
jgi:hypothetical protein